MLVTNKLLHVIIKYVLQVITYYDKLLHIITILNYYKLLHIITILKVIISYYMLLSTIAIVI